jgi:zinc D-Ala-D-Ala dipeptidase
MGSPQDDETRRRRYWTRLMDEAYGFMLAIQGHPCAECGEPLAPLPDAARAAGVKVLFSPLPHVRGLPRLFYLRQGIVPDLLAAAEEMNRRGWALKIEDAYRTREMQKYNALRPDVFLTVLAKTRWERGGEYPSFDLFRRRLAALIAMSPGVGTHCCGSAVDISVLARDGSAEIDRGAPYLEMSEKTPMGSPFISAQASRNREEITAIMARHGFMTYPYEFWHYNKGDAHDEFLAKNGAPARYGPIDFEPATGAIRPIADPMTPLNSEEEITLLMRDAMGRDGAHGNLT